MWLKQIPPPKLHNSLCSNKRSKLYGESVLNKSIQLTAMFSLSIDEFYDIDGETKFIDRMCAILQVEDTSKLKIVGIYTGSVIVQAFLEEEAESEETS